MNTWVDRIEQLPRTRFRSLIVAVIVIGGAALYANTLGNGYGIDDEFVTVTNAASSSRPNHPIVARGLDGVGEAFRSPFVVGEEHSFGYRPLVVASYALEYEFFGANPLVSHLVNLMLYSSTVWVIFLVQRQIFPGQSQVFHLVAIVLFLFHPLHTEVVNNLKSRDELLSALGGLLGLFFLLRFAQLQRKRYLIFAALAVWLAFYSKTSVVVFAGIYPVVFLLRSPKSWRHAVGALMVFLIGFAMYRFSLSLLPDAARPQVDRLYENPLLFSSTWTDRFALSAWSFGFYLRQLLVPVDLVSYYGYRAVPPASWSSILAWFGVIAHGLLAFIAVRSWRNSPVLAVGLTWYLGVSLAFSNLVSPVRGIVGERFAYVSSIGFLWVVAWVLCDQRQRWCRNATNSARVTAAWTAILAIALGLASVRVVSRNREWRDKISLLQADVVRAPDSAKLHSLLASTLEQEPSRRQDLARLATLARHDDSRPQEASEAQRLRKRFAQRSELIAHHYREAIRILPDYTAAHNNLGVLLLEQIGDTEAAVQHLQRAVELDPSLERGFFNLGKALSGAGRRSEAAAAFRSALELDREFTLAHSALINLEITAGRFDQAAVAIAALHSSTGEDLRTKLIEGLIAGRDFDRGVSLARALLAHREHLATREMLLKLLVHQGRLEEAMTLGRKMTEQFPEHKNGYLLLSQLLIRQEDFAGAAEVNESALEALPDEAVFATNIGDLHVRALDGFEAALPWYERAWSLEPNDRRLVGHIARICEENGDFTNAARFRSSLPSGL